MDAFCVYTVTVPTKRACVKFIKFETLIDVVYVYDGTNLEDFAIGK